MGEEGRLVGRMGVMAAGANKFLLRAGRISFSLDGMYIADPIPAQDMFAVQPVRMARRAEEGHRFSQENGIVRRVRAVA
jgi:hypothetical protein